MSVAEKMTAIADAIREKTGGTEELSLDDMANEIPNVYEKGQDDGVTAFLNEFQQNGNRTNYQSAFGAQWTKEMFAQLPHPVRPKNAYMMFWTNSSEYMIIDDFVEFCEENNIILDFSNCENAYYGLARLHGKHFGTLDFRKCTNLDLLFYSHRNSPTKGVKKIDNFISSEITGFRTNTFQHATGLTDIKMSGVVANSINFGTCPLNRASIISVVNVLSSSTTGQTVTFKKTAVNTAFGINVDDASTFTDEFKALRNSKANWTFSYA